MMEVFAPVRVEAHPPLSGLRRGLAARGGGVSHDRSTRPEARLGNQQDGITERKKGANRGEKGEEATRGPRAPEDARRGMKEKEEISFT
jgi:hypothetical protein